jgi:DNA-binding CsgD family transcriptional regulator
MPGITLTQGRDRRGRSERGASGLLEREALLAAIDDTLERAGEGRGQALLIEGHAGIGKTRLHEAALDAARRRGFRVLRAAGAELERHLAFGLAAQLLAAQLDELSASRRRSLLAGLPEHVRALVDPEADSGSEDHGSDLGLVHGVFTALATADETRPALLAIDDLHWCDSASLELVLYLLHRLAELPLALVMTSRIGVEEATTVLDKIASQPPVHVEALAPLGRDAVAQLARRELGERADAEVVEACLEATGGNPFFLRELLRALGNEGGLSSAELTRRAVTLVPDAVIRTLRVRVGRLGGGARVLARAVVVLGDDVPLRHAAALAELELDAAVPAADALAQVAILLAREPLRFVHPLVRQALEQDIPAAELGMRHFQAAQLLQAENAGPERVAAHLLLSHRRGDPWVVERLRAAAREARTRAVPQSAVRYLRRALEEPPADDALRAEVLAELGIAEAAAGLPEAPGRFAQAIATAALPLRRVQLALERGRCLDSQGLHEQAARAYDAGLAELPAEPESSDELELRDQLEADFVATASVVPSLQRQALERSADLLDRAAEGPNTQGQRLRLAQTALYGTFNGEHAQTSAALAERAWDGGRLLEHGTPQGIGWRMVSSVLLLAGELERAAVIADAALEDARRRGWPFSLATASYMRALPLLWQARVDDSLSELDLAREARRVGWRQFARASAAHHALALIEKNELDRAEQILLEDVPPGATERRVEVPTGDWGKLADTPPSAFTNLEDAMRLYSLARLRLSQGQAEEALKAALACGAVVEATVGYYGYCPWRVAAAEAALNLGDRERALELATLAAERAERTQVLHERIRTQRVLGLCQGPKAGLAALTAAAELADGAPPRLETIRTLVELGAALRRANKRVAAREPLQQAADMAWAGGATALHERARTELAATGARPRRAMLLSGPDSLTPSERRIAELAATGASNREIAQTLFVTPKTVEYHLRNTYRKLDIDGRESLSTVLVA